MLKLYTTTWQQLNHPLETRPLSLSHTTVNNMDIRNARNEKYISKPIPHMIRCNTYSVPENMCYWTFFLQFNNSVVLTSSSTPGYDVCDRKKEASLRKA